ncbi:MAG: hypothetical protein LBP67_03895 [Bacteroidales bacterium]|jgi:hypothetical protein|nr:hypothetical protein [Bacteroidales bacterium]
MSKKTRQTLKESFKQGKKPSEQDFENLIDSTMNILDDGFRKSPESGMGLAPLSEKGTVLSVFWKTTDDNPQWEIAIEQTEGNLEIRKREDEGYIPVLVLRTDGNIIYGQKDKKAVFAGGVSMPVREGIYAESVPADGKWHDITVNLDACQALEVVAVTGKKNSLKHAVLMAHATSCFGNHSKIKKISSHYGRYGHRICIRWKKSGHNKCKLQLKTKFPYREDIQIQCHITSLLSKNILL